MDFWFSFLCRQYDEQSWGQDKGGRGSPRRSLLIRNTSFMRAGNRPHCSILSENGVLHFYVFRCNNRSLLR
jgi:hypothetical protein